MNSKSIVLGLALSCVVSLGSARADAGKIPSGGPKATLLVEGLTFATGSTIGPDGALYVTEGTAGRITRVDPKTGKVSTFASGLPGLVDETYPFGGVVDVAFIGKTAYALVTLVGSDIGGSEVVGIYRVDGPNRFTVIADIGAFALQNPPTSPFFVPTGVQYALQVYRGGFLVSDGHHNRVLQVTLDGKITELIAFDNVVPTGMAVWGNTIYLTQAGPVPHEPEDGTVVAFESKSLTPEEVASGAPLLVDVEFGRGRLLYALSQGEGSGDLEGSPAEQETGALLKVNEDGSFSVIVDRLDRPTSLEFIGNTAYVVTIPGKIWKIDGVSGPPYGPSH